MEFNLPPGATCVSVKRQKKDNYGTSVKHKKTLFPKNPLPFPKKRPKYIKKAQHWTLPWLSTLSQLYPIIWEKGRKKTLSPFWERILFQASIFSSRLAPLECMRGVCVCVCNVPKLTESSDSNRYSHKIQKERETETEYLLLNYMCICPIAVFDIVPLFQECHFFPKANHQTQL